MNRNYERLAGLLRDDFDEGEIEQIYQVLCDMPSLNVELHVIGSLRQENDVHQRVAMPTTKNHWLPIHQNEVCNHHA